ncbi:hypothetical protein GCM10007390_35480 [Persicitalea jodogahamensis]|uniref:histidine kinase n=2 Tax=Persicitalea jodogahamensis TaxID=402147 RepID=A0A8J3DBE6_9BACT|nr:hypothetical protein GCM10007390_35480 [Persicitalea jodogahamensis]
MLSIGRVLAQDPAFPPIAEKRQHAQEVEREARAKNDSLLLAEAYYLYGKLYAFAGDHVASKTAFLNSLRILEPRGDSYDLGRLYVRLCENSRQISQTRDEIRYAYRAKALFERIKSLKGQVLANATLAQVFERRYPYNPKSQRPDSAVIFLKTAERLNRQIEDSLGMADINLKLGELFLFRHDPRAITHLLEAQKWLHVKKNLRTRLNTQILLGRAYIDAGQPEKGLSEIQSAAQLYKTNGLNDHLLDVTMDRAMLDYYEHTNQWQSAHKRFGELYRKENLQFAAERDGVLARLQVEYETEKKENLLKIQQLELDISNRNHRQDRIVIGVVLFLFLVAGVLSVLFFQLFKKYQGLSLKNEHLVREQNHRAISNLQQISSLLNLQARQLSDIDARQAMEESQLRVQSMSLIQSRLFGSIDSPLIDLTEFIPALANGVLLAYGYAKIDTTYRFDPLHLSPEQTIPLGLILTELVTNACKYAFPGSIDPCLIIGCHRNANQIELTVSDNGPGLDFDSGPGNTATTITPTNSYGLEMIRMQVRQLRGNYYFAESKPGSGTLFTLNFTDSVA